MRANTPLRVVLLDVDGTLIDSNNAHAQSWFEALEQHGYHVPFSKIRPLIGMGGDRLLPEVAGISEDSLAGKNISATRKQIFEQKYLPDLQPFPEVRPLLQRLRDEGLRVFVASSSGKETLGELLKKAGVADLVDNATSKDDAESSKPAPDIIEAALKLSGVRPEEAVMIGDTPYDVEAAEGAGVACIAFECGGWSPMDLKRAVAVYRDAADLLKNFSMSPLSQNLTSPSEAQL